MLRMQEEMYKIIKDVDVDINAPNVDILHYID